jgi:hypothetical protein
MGEAIGQMLPFAVGVAVSPMPIVAVVLMLVTRRARINGPAFLVGWVVGIAIVGAIALAIAGPTSASEEGQPANWVNWLKLVLGVLLLLVALREWRARPAEGEEVAAPKWMGMIERFTPVKALEGGRWFSVVSTRRTCSSSLAVQLRSRKLASPLGSRWSPGSSSW